MSKTDLSKYQVVFSDSLELLDIAYKKGLNKGVTVKTTSPVVFFNKNINFKNVTSRWTVKEMKKFQEGVFVCAV